MITDSADFAFCVYAEDLDGDGDMDVLFATKDDHSVSWFENNGIGNFGQRQIITTSASSVEFICTADLDGDGDMDLLSSSTEADGWDGEIAWYENDGNGNFGEKIGIPLNEYSFNWFADLFPIDIDADGDLDIFGSSLAVWYQNEGNGTFVQKYLDFLKI